MLFGACCDKSPVRNQLFFSSSSGFYFLLQNIKRFYKKKKTSVPAFISSFRAASTNPFQKVKLYLVWNNPIEKKILEITYFSLYHVKWLLSWKGIFRCSPLSSTQSVERQLKAWKTAGCWQWSFPDSWLTKQLTNRTEWCVSTQTYPEQGIPRKMA